MVDSFRGKLRVRKWPEKRGTPKSEAVRTLNRWFTEVNRLAKLTDPSQQIAAMEATKGTGLYPRDLLIRTMSSGMFDVIFPDGREMEYRPLTMEQKVFAGARCVLATPQAFAAGVAKTVVWPLPVIDTFGFWDVANPTRLTIPTGVSVVELTFGWLSTASLGLVNTGTAIVNSAGGGAGVDGRSSSFGRRNASTGPVPVNPGDFFTASMLSPVAGSLNGTGWTFFALNVLGTTP